jgi:putative ABC transport system ATP-binding protein
MATVGLGLTTHDLRLSYPLPGGDVLQVLNIPQLDIPAGSAVGITGPSGSGKTSLLYVLVGLERPQQGTVSWGETEITRLPEAARDRWRRRSVGFVFQDFHLFPGMSALQNVLLPTAFDHFLVPEDANRRARTLLHRVGLENGRGALEKLSRGEMQRVAVARALLFAPAVVVADEPTASLDSENGRTVGDLLLEMCRQSGSTLVVVSHDPDLLGRLDAIHTLVGGRLSPREGVGALRQ